MNLRNLLKTIAHDSQGATAIEYGLIASLVVIACITAMQGVADETIDMWDFVKTKAVEAMD